MTMTTSTNQIDLRDDDVGGQVIALRRPAVVGALYHDLGLRAGGDGDDDEAVPEEVDAAPRRGLRRFLHRPREGR